MKLKSNLAQIKKQNLNSGLKNQKISNINYVGRIYRDVPKINVKFYGTSLFIASILGSILILNLVKNHEISDKINKTKKQIQIQSSEQIRLKAELERLINLKTIENYAKQKLNMKKFDNSQIIYINTKKKSSQQSKNKNNNNKSKTNTFFNLLCNMFKNLLNNFSN